MVDVGPNSISRPTRSSWASMKAVMAKAKSMGITPIVASNADPTIDPGPFEFGDLVVLFVERVGPILEFAPRRRHRAHRRLQRPHGEMPVIPKRPLRERARERDEHRRWVRIHVAANSTRAPAIDAREVLRFVANDEVGLGGKGNEGVAGQVKQTPGSIGYVELAYAMQNRQPVASIRNSSGRFVEPSIASITAAAAGIADTLSADTDYRISIVNAPGADAYPIASFTWILVYGEQRDAAKGRKLVDFLRWAVTSGQQHAAALHYAPLPAGIVTGVQKKLDAISIPAA